MNHVTFETAKRLKEARFPQPEFSTLQLWWGVRFPEGTARKDVLCVVTERITSKYSYSFDFTPSDGLEHTDFGNYTFAPTATEILKNMPQCYYMCFTNIGWQIRSVVVENPGQNQAWAKGEVSTHWAQSTHANPAEAAAMAWMALNKKT